MSVRPSVRCTVSCRSSNLPPSCTAARTLDHERALVPELPEHAPNLNWFEELLERAPVEQ